MDIASVITEIGFAKDRLAKAKSPLDPKVELTTNLYPLLSALAETVKGIDERLAETSDIVADVIAGTESVLQEEDAEKLSRPIIIGLNLVAKLRQVIEAAGLPISEELEKEIASFGIACHEAATEIAAIVTAGGTDGELDDQEEGK